MQVNIYSPLQNVSNHFVDRLSEALARQGIETNVLDSLDGEMGKHRRAKVVGLLRHVWDARRYCRASDPTVVAWPLLGWWETLLWKGQSETFIAMHDPTPLRPQIGLSPRAARVAARLGGKGSPWIVVHSPEAAEVAGRFFDRERIRVLPHPMAVPQRPRDEPLRQVLVLGQFKPARDLEVMATIGPPLRAAGFLPVVAGRGWPEVAGWDVIDEFLSEADFVRLLTSSAAVLIPYAHYYQSGVALRALEHGTPVVGRATGFLEGVLGSNFSGAVEVWDDPSSWIAAVVRAVGGVADQLQRASRFAAEGGAMWAGALRARVSSGSPSE